jgi:hypothetical protein
MQSRTRSRFQRNPTARCTASRGVALRLLSKAWKMAREIRRSPWNLAVELEVFVAEHISLGDLHWLVSEGYAEHRVETTRLGSSRRTFRAAGPAFTVRSCFVLTERGIQAARQHGAQEGPDGRRVTSHRKGRALRTKPRWDGQLRQLWVGKELVKWFRVPAGNQETILAAFQEQGWPAHIDDPLPGKAGVDPKGRLHAAIRRLNGRQLRRLLCFRGDGTGMGVCWELIDAE